LWAETTTINLTNGSAVCTEISNGNFSFSPEKGTGNYDPSYNTDTDKSGLRLFAGNSLTISSSSLTITNVSIQFTKDGSNDNIRSSSITNLRIDTNDDSSWAKTFTGKSYSGNNNGLFNISLSPARKSLVFNFNRIDPNKDGDIYIASITITYSDNRSSLTQFAFNPDEVICHGDKPAIYVNNTNLIYDANNAILKTKVIIDPAYSTAGASLNNSSFTVSSSDNTVVDATGSIAITQTNNGTRLYFDGLQVKKSGTVTLTYNFLGTETYKPSSFTQEITVIDPIDTFEGSYKYTWDFAGGNWTTSILQLGYGYSGWTKTISETASEARPSTATSISATNGIDIIKGLAFTLNNPADLCLDWFSGRKAIWIANGASVTIPNLTKDQRITITADGNNFSITSGNATVTDNVITVTGDGDVTIQMTNNTRIQSIAVSNTQYGWEYTTESTTLEGVSRKTKGTFTFTEEGPIAGGTVIKEVPGITMTVGTSTDSWNVCSATAIDGYNLGAAAAYCSTPAYRPAFTSGCFYKFEPIVNGELKVRYYTANEVFFSEGETAGTKQDGTRIQDKTFTVEAGKTYYLSGKGGGLYLNSYTFTPKFFAPGTTTDQLTVGKFTAHVNDPAISAFPKLIDPTSEAQQNRVKFAGDRTIVHLYKNNDVEIIGTGTNVLIRGTVLDKNNEDGLVAYYYLDSYVLNLVSSELDDQAYINTDGLGADKKYTFTFSGDIASAADASVYTVNVKVKTDAQNEVEVGANISGATLNINFGDLSSAEGSTYRITIPANVVALEGDAATKNSEIIRTFSVNKAEELQVKMVYPTDIATVGTTIVLETYVDGSTSGLTLNDGAKVKAVLSAEGETDMEIDATFSGNHLSFKPTHTLTYNKDYTLTYTYNATNNVITSQPVSDKIYKVTHDKVFTFTTGSSSGTAPVVATTSPTADAVIPGSAYSGGRISFTFDQTVDLEPFSTVTVTPVNGSEATTTASTHAPGAGGNTLLVDSDGKTVYFNYNADGVKYDLYYQVVIPANTVVGVGGLPNSEPITLNFRMGKNPNATELDPNTFYPHTWDFTTEKIGTRTNTVTAFAGYDNTNAKKAEYKWTYTPDPFSISNYTTNSATFDQGVALNIKGTTIEEADGLRVSLVHNERQSAAGRVQLNGNSLFFNGGTHYITIPDVPKGKLYIVANLYTGNTNNSFNINSPNAVFTNGYSDNEKKKATQTGQEVKYVIDVTEAGDVSFCLQNVRFYKIAVAADTKTFKKNYVKDGKTYATDCLGYDVRYDLLNAFTDHSVKAYYITDMANSTGNTATVTATEVNQVNAVKGSQGVLVVYQGAVENNTEVPVFKTDVNTSAKEVVASGATSEQLVNLFKTKDEIASKPADHYLYVLSYTGSQGGGLGFYNYVGSAYIDRAAYLFMSKEWVGEDPYGSGTTSARKVSLITIDAEGVTTGVSEVETEKTPNNDGYFYNLNGMRVEHPKAGIYIRNGKKVVMK
jgi:hypothetical protein